MLGNAATNVAFPLTITCTALSLMFGIGGAANFNLSMGHGEREDAARYAGNAVLCCFTGLILCLGVRLFLKPLMIAFGATAEVLDYSLIYTGITSLGFPFLILTTGGSNLIRADGSPLFLHGLHTYRRTDQHDLRPFVYLYFSYGNGRCCSGNHYRPDCIRYHGNHLSDPL